MICKLCGFSCRQIENRHHWQKNHCSTCHYIGRRKPYNSTGRPKIIKEIMVIMYQSQRHGYFICQECFKDRQEQKLVI